jgi:hypothetical protein
MKRRWVLAIVAANALALVALAFVYPHLMVGPGALAAGHADLATDCFACHAPFQGASAELCIACHTVANIGAKQGGAPGRTKAPVHRDLLSQDCMACHTDHAAPRLARGSRRPFAHDLLAPATATQCAACHKPPDLASHRDLGTACATCHRTTGWKPASFDHDKYFVLDRHHNTSCVTCHTEPDRHRTTCYGCHEHRPEKIRREHLEEGISDVSHCATCHRSASGEPRRGGKDRD